MGAVLNEPAWVRTRERRSDASAGTVVPLGGLRLPTGEHSSEDLTKRAFGHHTEIAAYPLHDLIEVLRDVARRDPQPVTREG